MYKNIKKTKYKKKLNIKKTKYKKLKLNIPQ